MQSNKNYQIKIDGRKMKIAIVLPYFHDELGLTLLTNTENELLKQGVKKNNIKIIRVPGALEIPFASQKIIKKIKPHVVIALGIVIRGETSHYDLVVNTTYQGLMNVQLQTATPIIFGILTCENLKQVKNRISKSGEDKGTSFAQAALIQATLN